MPCEKTQPWKTHYVPEAGNPSIVSYQENKGAEIIADGGSAGPPVEEGIIATKDVSIRAENRLCPHLKAITNPTL